MREIMLQRGTLMLTKAAIERAVALFGVWVCLICSATVSALPNGEAQSSASTQAFIDMFKDVNSLEGQFRQVLVDADGEPIAKSQGVFKSMRPGKFYWKTEQPGVQEVIGNGETLWVFDPDIDQVTVKSQASQGVNPAQILSGDATVIRANFSVNHTIQGNRSRFTLIPRDELQAVFQSLEFVFKNQKLVELQMYDKLDQVTAITFSKVQKNRKFDASDFEFVPPEGVDVIAEDSVANQ